MVPFVLSREKLIITNANNKQWEWVSKVVIVQKFVRARGV